MKKLSIRAAVCAASLGLALAVTAPALASTTADAAGPVGADDAVAAAQQETADADADALGTDVECSLEDGGYVIRIALDNEDLGWYADGMDGEQIGDGGVVELASAGVEDGAFVARYDAVGDGQATVSVRHYYTGFACDQEYTWHLEVSDGEIQDVSGGSYTATSPDEVLDTIVSGHWVQQGEGNLMMTATKGAEQGWDVVITAPDGEEPYVFKTTVYQDCTDDAVLYDKGKFFDAPADGSETENLGEARVAGTTGSFSFSTEDGETLLLTWNDEQSPDVGAVFVRTVEFDLVGSELYSVDDLAEAVDLVEQEFATWEGCELHSIRYGGDDCNDEANVAWLNDLNEDGNYVEALELVSDFHSPVEGGGAWEPDMEYIDYQWWLARPEGGDWELLSWGY